MAGSMTTTVARALEELYALGIKPDWWKLEPQASGEAWRAIGAVIQRHDPYCRGIVLLGLEAPEAELERAFAAAAGHEMVKGFAVGRTIFNEAAEAWLPGKMDDEAAIDDMAGRFGNLSRLALAQKARGVSGIACQRKLASLAHALEDRPGDGRRDMTKTIRLTMAQALARFLTRQMTEIDGKTVPLFAGVWAIFGHGNVAGLGEALYGVRKELPTYRAHNEQAMAHSGDRLSPRRRAAGA